MELGILVREENVIALNKLVNSIKLPWRVVYRFSQIKEAFQKQLKAYADSLNSIMYTYGRLQEQNEKEDVETNDKEGKKFTAKLRRLTIDQMENKNTEIKELEYRDVEVVFPVLELSIFKEIYKADQKEIRKLEKHNAKKLEEGKEEKEIDMSKYLTGNDIMCYFALGIAVEDGEENID